MTQVFPFARLLQPAQARLLPFVVELVLTPPKVPRRAVRNISLDGQVRYGKEANDSPLSRAGPGRFPH